MPPQNPQPHAPAVAADGADSSEEEEESDTEADAQASEMHPVSSSPAKAAAAVPQPESDADEEEGDGESDESEPEVPELVQKKAAATNKSKNAESQDKKRPVSKPAPSSKAKKAKVEAGMVASEATQAGKGKKAKSELEKAPAVQTPSGKAKKPGSKQEKLGLDTSPSKSARAQRIWSKEDVIKILEALAGHVKREGVLPKTDVILAAVHDHLDRKNCTYTDLYEKIRGLKKRFVKIVSTGVMPSGEDELRIYNLSDATWGEKAKEAFTATVTMSNKGQSKRDKVDGNAKGGTLMEATNDTQKGSKQQGNGKEEFGKDAKSGTSKEAATQNDDALTKRKRGKMDKDKMDIDPIPKDVSNGNQNGGTRTEEETEKGTSLQGTYRSFDELQKLYPNLAWCVERIESQHPCGETLMRAFGFIGDEKANAMESKIKLQRLSAAKEQTRGADLKKVILNKLIGLVD
jgi:hypothetical protein